MYYKACLYFSCTPFFSKAKIQKQKPSPSLKIKIKKGKKIPDKTLNMRMLKMQFMLHVIHLIRRESMRCSDLARFGVHRFRFPCELLKLVGLGSYPANTKDT